MLRRRQQRWRSPGRRIALPGPDLSRVEAGLARASQPAGPLFLDLVLRCLTTATSGIPSLRAAQLTCAGVELVLAEPQPPPAFATTGDHESTWWTPTDATLPLTAATAVGVANPYPALASIGTRDDDGTILLLDLEHAGALHLRGDPGHAVDLLRHIAVELATSRWADATTVLTVGLHPDLTGLPSHRVQHLPDLSTALARASCPASRHRRAPADSRRSIAARAAGPRPAVRVLAGHRAPDRPRRPHCRSRRRR